MCLRTTYRLLHDNRIAVIANKTFAGISNLNKFDIGNNLIQSIVQGVNGSQYGGTFCSKDGLDHKIVLNPNPLACVMTSADVTEVCPAEDDASVNCSTCGFGYLVDEAHLAKTSIVRCLPQTFGLNPMYKDLQTELRALLDEKTIYRGLPLKQVPAQLYTKLKKELFVGYSASGLGSHAISYELDFRGIDVVDITCDEVFVGDTLADGTTNQWQLGSEFVSREGFLRFNVTKEASVFTFDGCDSRFAASLAVYRTNDTHTLFVQPTSENINTRDAPNERNCPLSLTSTVTTPPLAKGSYVLMVQGTALDDITVGGVYEVNMVCLNGSDSAGPHRPANPGGLVVNNQTGEMYGTSQRTGNYTVDYNAIDSGGSRATLATWSFTVAVEPVFQKSSNTFVVALEPNAEHPKGKLDLSDELAIGVTYRYKVNSTINTYVDGNLGNVSYRLAIYDMVQSNVLDDILINTQTGTFQATPMTAYNAIVDIIAVDTGGADRSVVLATWNITSMQADIVDDKNGPGGKGCSGHGTKVDIIKFNNEFTCDCNAGYNISANCEVPEFVIAVLASILALFGGYRLHVYRIKHRPIDMKLIQHQLLAGLGVGVTANMTVHEVGVSVTVCPIGKVEDLEGSALVAFEGKLLTMVAARLKMPLADAWVQTGDAPVRAFIVVFNVPENTRDPRFATNVLKYNRELNNATNSNNNNLATIHHLQRMQLTSVAIAVHHSTPVELIRSSLLRLDDIGFGNSSTVFKGLLSERRHGHTYKTVVAVKCCNMKSTDKTRENLLKEAALTALFDHRNVLSLIGVLTSPRNLPAFMVLPYCDNGSLHQYLLESSGGVPIHTKLTFCAEIARGLAYIAARRVIHRDVAARNVLLDILLVCKVADFGMSTRLNEAKEYTRIDYKDPDDNDVPVRWAAPEVVKEGKYSLHTDVWAFGVLIWEVFSNGRTPYDHLTLIEVVGHIRNNKVLPGPTNSEYPKEIYDKLMAGCFCVDPFARPAFGQLYDTCIQLGGSEDEVAVDDYRKKKQESMHQGTDVNVLPPEVVMARLGPSVHHLTTSFIRGTMRAMNKTLRKYPGLNCVEDTLISQMVDAYGRPAGLNVLCPRDGEPGAAYVDTLEGVDNVGIAIALLSYSWGYKVKDVVDALAEWTRTQGREPKQTYIWICSLCLNQHRIVKALTPDKLAQEFGDRVTGIGRILPMMEDWKNSGYTRRAWCLFELYTALRMKAHVIDVDIILTPTQRELCAVAIETHGFKVIDEALDQVKSEDAEATEPADLAAIQALIQRYQGGYSALNEAVKMRLRAWFQKIAGIRFARTLNNVEGMKVNKTTSLTSIRSALSLTEYFREGSTVSTSSSSTISPSLSSSMSSATTNSRGKGGGKYSTLVNRSHRSRTSSVDEEPCEEDDDDDDDGDGVEADQLNRDVLLATTIVYDDPEKNDNAHMLNAHAFGIDTSSC
eukprot:m.175813 g.175813  ORF g.175813 m.175813 type:complete len:1446 (+) comp31832_c1_seq1:205-4542(+)